MERAIIMYELLFITGLDLKLDQWNDVLLKSSRGDLDAIENLIGKWMRGKAAKILYATVETIVGAYVRLIVEERLGKQNTSVIKAFGYFSVASAANVQASLPSMHVRVRAYLCVASVSMWKPPRAVFTFFALRSYRCCP